MKAICKTPDGRTELRDVPTPNAAPEGHVIIKIETCEINPGDKFFLSAKTMSVAGSLHDVWGVSGIGKVTSIGANVPTEYRDQTVLVYRSLHGSPHVIGTWSEYAQLPYLSCVIVPPDAVKGDSRLASLVNLITPYAFAKQAQREGRRGILVTAGASATGLAMIGIGEALGLSVVSLIRDGKGRAELEACGAKNILAENDPEFAVKLTDLLEKLQVTAVFEGVGGEMITRIAPLLPATSVISSYGQLAGPAPMTIPLHLLMAKDLTVRSFSNFRSETVRDPKLMSAALKEISQLLHHPSLRTKGGKEFRFEEIEAALAFTGSGQGKAVLKV